MSKYKQLSPPNYDTSVITAPVALFYGKNDPFAAVSVSIQRNNLFYINLNVILLGCRAAGRWASQRCDAKLNWIRTFHPLGLLMGYRFKDYC